MCENRYNEWLQDWREGGRGGGAIRKRTSQDTQKKHSVCL